MSQSYEETKGKVNFAEALYNAGYGNIAEAIKELSENTVKPLIDEIVELMFDDSRSVCQIKKCHKSDDIPCGASICIEENKLLWKSKLDKLIKERFGNES